MYASTTVETAIASAAEIEDELVRLMNRHERTLFNFVLVQTGNVEAAQDCVQEAFLRAYENLRKGKPVNAAWLYRVARHRAIDGFRKERRSQSGTDLLDQIAGASRLDRTVAVRLVLASMPSKDRLVLYLFEVAGFKTDEIGAMLGMRGSAVRQRLYRARERFKALYGPLS